VTVSKLDAVIFDIGGTLVRHAPPGTAVADLTPELIGTAADDLERLAGRFRVGAVTDTSVMTEADVRAALAGSGLEEHLEVIITSVDVGAAKPDPRGLRRAIEQLGASPATTLFVGDAEVDAGAAEAAGTHFAWSDGVRSPGSIVDEFLSGLDHRS
jgi:FMN phosphatase YigB (HAD superfamily)